MSTVTKTRRPRKIEPRVFRCEFHFAGDRYLVKPLAGIHPEVAVKAYQLAKQTGDRDVYHIRLTPEGYAECDCKGHQRHGHCKHVSMLTALGCLPATCQPTSR